MIPVRDRKGDDIGSIPIAVQLKTEYIYFHIRIDGSWLGSIPIRCWCRRRAMLGFDSLVCVVESR